MIVLFLSTMPLFVSAQKQIATPIPSGFQQINRSAKQAIVPSIVYLIDNILSNWENKKDSRDSFKSKEQAIDKKNSKISRKLKQDPESIFPDHSTGDLGLSHFSGISYDSIVYLKWKATLENDVEWLFIEKSANRKDFYKVGEIDLTNKKQVTNFDFTDHELLAKPVYYYQIKALTNDGSILISDFIAVKNNLNAIKISITPGNEKDILLLNSNQAISKIEVVDQTGRILLKNNQPQKQEIINIKEFQPGVYAVKVFLDSGSVSEIFITK